MIYDVDMGINMENMILYSQVLVTDYLWYYSHQSIHTLIQNRRLWLRKLTQD